jgi:hypothetical protein
MDELKLKSYLNRGTVLIQFEKKDGTLREMNATRSKEFIGEDSLPSGDSQRAKGPDNVWKVFDVDANEWRSFRIENLKRVFDVEIQEWLEFIQD